MPFGCLSKEAALGFRANALVHYVTRTVVLKTPNKYIAGSEGQRPFQNRIKDAEECLADEKEWYCVLDDKPHPNRLQSFMSTSEGIWMPRMKTNLKHLLWETPERPINPKSKYQWAMEIAAAAASLETLRLAHCDIRPANILIDYDDHVKLGDFDTLSRYGEYSILNVATDWIWYDRCCGPRNDLFGIGNTFWELFTEVEYDWGTPEEPKLTPDTTGTDYGDIMSRCWHSTYSSISDLAEETEARYLTFIYGNFAPVIQTMPFLKRLCGETEAQVMGNKELAQGQAIIEKFLIDPKLGIPSADKP